MTIWSSLTLAVAGWMFCARAAIGQQSEPDEASARMRSFERWVEQQRYEKITRPRRERAAAEARLAEWNRRIMELIMAAEETRGQLLNAKAYKRLRKAMSAVKSLMD